MTGAPATPTTADASARGFALDPQQVAHFETFGFVKLPGLFADDIERIRRGFDAVFAAEPTPQVLDPDNPFHEADDPEQQQVPRLVIPAFIDRSEDLAWLRTDERVVGIAESLLGPDPTYAESDGNLFNCNLHWHLDAYGAPIHLDHVKMYFYLDPLTAETGSLRVMPGSHYLSSDYVDRLRHDLADPAQVEEIFGVSPEELPYWSLDPQPGDLVVGDFRLMHASFHGGAGRRLFTVNFRRAEAPAEP